MATEIPGDFGRGRLYLTPHCHHQNVVCIKVGIDESHFDVSLIVRDKVTRQCPQTTTFKEREGPKRNRTDVLLLTNLTLYHLAKLVHDFVLNALRRSYIKIFVGCK